MPVVFIGLMNNPMLNKIAMSVTIIHPLVLLQKYAQKKVKLTFDLFL